MEDRNAISAFRACVLPCDQISGCTAENPARRQTGTFYILCLRDFEILGARDFKRDEGERLIFWPRSRLPAYSSSWITTVSRRKVSIDPLSLHQSG